MVGLGGPGSGGLLGEGEVDVGVKGVGACKLFVATFMSDADDTFAVSLFLTVCLGSRGPTSNSTIYARRPLTTRS